MKLPLLSLALLCLATTARAEPPRRPPVFAAYCVWYHTGQHPLLTSWNEWPETTVVESSSTWPDPYLYLRILAEWKGIPFVAPPLPKKGK